jgi:uncharacterized repeat protein (TIGR01451 family)
MKTQLLRLGVLSILVSIAFLIPLSFSALAQDKNPGTPTPTAGKGATPTPTLPKKALPSQQPEGVNIPSAVDYRTSSLNARGTHPGENSTFILIIANKGNTTGAASEAHITIPANVTYVPGSAQVQGGGALQVIGKSINWNGAVASSASITITYHVILPNVIGQAVDTVATVFDPGLPAAITLENSLVIQAPVGGPDAYGYTYQDNLAAGSGVTFNWIPTTTLSTKVNMGPSPVDDEVSAALPIGFTFRFYKNTYTDLYVNSNGLVMFGPGNATNVDNTPEPIPTPGSTDNYASCFWADLYMLNDSQGVWIETFGAAPNRYTVITFRAAYFADMQAAPDLFQMILYETTNRVKCQYAQTSGPVYGSGEQSQIGMENDDGTAGLSYYFSFDYKKVFIGPLQDNLAILFTPGPASLPVFVTSTLNASANTHPGDVATYTLRVRNSGTAPSTITTVSDPIPPGATYVSGSANVQGGGILTANSSGVNWSGTVATSSTVTITYQVQLPVTLGSLLVNTATISDPQASAPVKVTSKDLTVMPAPTGGPDSFGYTYQDSYAGVTYNWVPTTTNSKKIDFGVLPADDVVTGTIPIGFPFRFYSGVYTDFYVSSNGLVGFGAGSDHNINLPIPTAGDGADNFAACFWYDLYIRNASQGVWVETSGTPPNRQTVITFLAQYFIAVSDPTVPPSLFQMILYEGSNQIKCQYAQMSGSIEGSGGTGATVGLENLDGTSGIQYFFRPAYSQPIPGPLEDNLAVLFTPGPEGPAFTASSKSVSESMHPGQTASYTVVIKNDASVPSSISTLSDPIPPGTSYLPGSAKVVGGGLLVATSSTVNWQGTIAASHSTTITFDVHLNAPTGLITNTATIADPHGFIPVQKTALTPIQPTRGFGVGSSSYRYRDSFDTGVSYSWVPTTTSSTKLVITQGDNDDGFGSVPLGFTFSFFDHPYSSVLVSTNGLVMFNQAGSLESKNLPIPLPGIVDNFATCFWDDQSINNPTQGIWSQTFGSAPDRYTVITFLLQDVNALSSPPYLYQMILFEDGGMIKCQYAQMSGSVNGDGRSATIGLEDRYGVNGVQYFFDRQQPPIIGPVIDGLAIEFVKSIRSFLPLQRR